MRRFIIPVVIVAALAILSAIISGASPTEAQGNSPPAANVQVVNGPTPGTVIVRWDAVPEATHYGIGYVNLLRDHPQAKAGATGNWRETFGNGFVGDRVALQAPATDCSGDDYDRDEWGEYPGADADAVPTWTLPSDDVASAEITLDHHVALKDAHVSGGCDWTTAMKNGFAMDPANLNPTTRSFNSSKGSRTPDRLTGIAQRIIDTDDEQCDYATQHDEVKDQYDLSMTESERETVTQWLALCVESPGGESATMSTTRPSMVSASYSAQTGSVEVAWTPDADAQQHWVVLFSLPSYEHGGRVLVRGADADAVMFEDVPPGRYEALVASYSKDVGFEYGDDTAFELTIASASTPDVTPMPGPTLPPPTPTQTFPASAVGGDYDYDNDGLIEVRTLAQLDAIRLDRSGNSRVDIDDLPAYLAAFPGALDDMGCPADGCNGYELAASLDFDTNGNGESDEGDAYWNNGAGWGEPIVPSYYGTFFGFEGNGYTIANLYINRPRADNVGLFGINYGTIRNVVLSGVDVTGGGYSRDPGHSGGVGGLVGFNRGDISGTTVSGTVSGEYNVGGLVGNNQFRISNNTASGTVSGNDNVGGLVGYNGSTIDDSSASGTVSGRANTGGLVGFNDGSTINDSTASGTVSGTGKVGGLVGWNAYNRVHNVPGAINRSTANGAVSGSDHIGGLVGDNAGAISDSTASGAVSGNNNRVGGLVGYNGGTIDDSSASGNVSGNDEVGGLAGKNAGSYQYNSVWQERQFGFIGNSTASGAVSGNDVVGGLVGYNWLGDINGSEAEGDATGRFYVGGLVGRNLGGPIREGTVNLGTIEDSTASGNVAGVRYRGELVGANDGGKITNSAGTGTVTTRQ